MSTKEVITHGVIGFLYVTFSLMIGIIFTDGLMLFMGWNMILVGGAFLSGILISKKHHKMKRYQLILMLGLWMLLFPNMMYMLTDFIHFQNASFFIIYANVYDADYRSWVLFFQITIGALYASYLAIRSFDMIYTVICERVKTNFLTIATAVFTLSSIGIYIGRFLRFNSWSVLNPLSLLMSFIGSLNVFSLFFISMFVLIHYFVYFLYHQFRYKPL